MNPVTFPFRAFHTPSIPTSVGPVKLYSSLTLHLHKNKNLFTFEGIQDWNCLQPNVGAMTNYNTKG